MNNFLGFSKGAYDPYNHVYTSSDVSDIVEFARQRGIRVVSEFDSPGIKPTTLSKLKEKTSRGNTFTK